MKPNKLLLPLLLIAFGCVAIGLFLHFESSDVEDYTEYFTGYDDRISFIVEGYQMHWDGFSPEDLELSYIYKYESPQGGFVKYDIDGDGTEELLLGDQFENGDYQIYDIFTFDKTTGDIIHLFCGGERNWCTVNGGGVIIETGSNSADDSFTRCWVLKNLKLKKGRTVAQNLLPLNMDKFINYAKPRGEVPSGGCTGPQAIVIIDNEGNVGRYIGENETSYQGEIQDTYWIAKDEARIDTFRACEGQGILTLKEPGRMPAFSSSDEKASEVGSLIYEDGYVPEVYRCLGYIRGWFLVEVDGKTGFIPECHVNWDAVNSF